MRFKKFITIIESLSPEVREVLAKAKFPVSQDILAAAIKELEDDAANYNTPAMGMQALRAKLGLGAAKEKQPKAEEIAEPTDPKLKPFYQDYKDKKLTIPEYKTAVYFKDADPDLLQTTLNDLRQLIDTKNINFSFADQPVITFKDARITNFSDLKDFSSRIHDIQGRIKEPAPAGFEMFRDPHAAELEKPGLQVWPPPNQKEPNESKIWIFKGDDYMKCKYFGAGVPWCVTKNPHNYWNYRSGGQTQYFLYDFNKDPDDPARFTNPGVAKDLSDSEWVDIRNVHSEDKDGVSFGINGYKSLVEYLKYLKQKGVPIKQVFVPEPMSKEETYIQDKLRSARGKEADKILPEIREKSEKALLLFLSLAPPYQIRLSKEAFSSLSPEEKEAFMIVGKKSPDNDTEKNYIENMSRKQAKDYLDDNEKEVADIAISLRYDNGITEKTMQNFAKSKNPDKYVNLESAIRIARSIGYKADPNLAEQILHLYMEDSKINKQPSSSSSLLFKQLKNLFMQPNGPSPNGDNPEFKKQFAEFFLKNKDKIMPVSMYFLPNMFDRTGIAHDLDVSNYLWSHLNDQEKIKALNNVENSAAKFENFNILKDAVRLEQYDPYMTRYPYVLNRYTPEQHEWVINNIGKDVYKLKNNSGGVTSPTLLKLILSLEQDNPEFLNQALVSFYLANKDDESFEKSLQWLTAMPNYNHQMLFGILSMTIISQAVRREKLDMLKNYIPESLIYDPTLAAMMFTTNYFQQNKNDLPYYAKKFLEFYQKDPSRAEKVNKFMKLSAQPLQRMAKKANNPDLVKFFSKFEPDES